MLPSSELSIFMENKARPDGGNFPHPPPTAASTSAHFRSRTRTRFGILRPIVDDPEGERVLPGRSIATALAERDRTSRWTTGSRARADAMENRRKGPRRKSVLEGCLYAFLSHLADDDRACSCYRAPRTASALCACPARKGDHHSERRRNLHTLSRRTKGRRFRGQGENKQPPEAEWLTPAAVFASLLRQRGPLNDIHCCRVLLPGTREVPCGPFVVLGSAPERIERRSRQGGSIVEILPAA